MPRQNGTGKKDETAEGTEKKKAEEPVFVADAKPKQEMPKHFVEWKPAEDTRRQRAPELKKRAAEVKARVWKWALGIAATVVIGAGLFFAGGRMTSVQQMTQESTRPAIMQQENSRADAYELRLAQLGEERREALSATGYSVQFEGIKEAQKAPVLQVEIEQAYRVDAKALDGMRDEEARVAAYKSYTGRIAEIAPEHVKAHAGMDSAFGAGRMTKAQYWQEHGELERIFKQLAKGRGEVAKQRYGAFGRKVAGAR
jgi:hypothetical protein